MPRGGHAVSARCALGGAVNNTNGSHCEVNMRLNPPLARLLVRMLVKARSIGMSPGAGQGHGVTDIIYHQRERGLTVPIDCWRTTANLIRCWIMAQSSLLVAFRSVTRPCLGAIRNENAWAIPLFFFPTFHLAGLRPTNGLPAGAQTAPAGIARQNRATRPATRPTIYRRQKSKKDGRSGNRTLDLPHAKRSLYH
ncbi:hypothetical protein LX32DRAFT_293377 [Colletotrichum zoysiae]|uniref:Uncharacterized protein n=1 Tax=Colletotrichum zoysiae TaxID=1216348 RepID=A0AAD9HNM9_9PEZI|nr:hypothetical protein LX32DRAFT_293377 [Colletotrichum zoysiae]